jgi:cutinase
MRTSASLLMLLSVPLALAAPTIIAIPEGGLNVRQSSDTRNDLTDGSACKAVTVIFARGTTESGNVGTLTGPPFFSALATAIGTGNLAVQGVDYPANVAGFLAGGDAAGSKNMADLVGQAFTQCPNTKVVISGYS